MLRQSDLNLLLTSRMGRMFLTSVTLGLDQRWTQLTYCPLNGRELTTQLAIVQWLHITHVTINGRAIDTIAGTNNICFQSAGIECLWGIYTYNIHGLFLRRATQSPTCVWRLLRLIEPGPLSWTRRFSGPGISVRETSSRVQLADQGVIWRWSWPIVNVSWIYIEIYSVIGLEAGITESRQTTFVKWLRKFKDTRLTNTHKWGDTGGWRYLL